MKTKKYQSKTLIAILLVTLMLLTLSGCLGKEQTGQKTNISKCKAITKPGKYLITQDLTSTKTCIHIRANNVTINGKNHRIKGKNIQKGIQIKNQDNILIKNTEITNYNHGIDIHDSSKIQITNNTIHSNTQIGINLESISKTTVKENKVNSHGYGGISITNSYSNEIKSNEITSNNLYGIRLSTSSSNKIINNTIHSTSQKGIDLTSKSNKNKIKENKICEGMGRNIYIKESQENTGDNTCDYTEIAQNNLVSCTPCP